MLLIVPRLPCRGCFVLSVVTRLLPRGCLARSGDPRSLLSVFVVPWPACVGGELNDLLIVLVRSVCLGGVLGIGHASWWLSRLFSLGVVLELRLCVLES